MLRVWGRRSSFNVQKVLWAIGELGIPYEHTDAGGSFGGLDTPEFLALNPHGRVPVVVDKGLAIWESHTILRYLAAQYGPGSLWPEQPDQRSLADRWIDWTATKLQPDFMRVFWGYFRTPEGQRDSNLVREALDQCEIDYGILDKQLSKHSFLGGATLTMGDIPAGATLYRYFEMGIDVPKPKNVIAWYERLAERPSYRQHVMVPFEELRGRLEF